MSSENAYDMENGGRMKIFKIVICVLLSGIILGLGAAFLLAYLQNDEHGQSAGHEQQTEIEQNIEHEENDAVVDDIVSESDGGGIVWGGSDERRGVVFIVDGVEYMMRSRLLHTTQPPDARGRAITASGLPETRAQTADLAPLVQSMGELEVVAFGNVTRDRGFTVYRLSGRDWGFDFSAPNTTNLLERLANLDAGEYLLIIYFIYGNAEIGSSGVEYSIRFVL